LWGKTARYRQPDFRSGLPRTVKPPVSATGVLGFAGLRRGAKLETQQ
jgi:hypothetical protein